MLDNNAIQHGLLIDLDGVIYQNEQLISGAIDTLDWIRQRDIPHLFVTNTTSRSRSALQEKFDSLGFSARAEEIMTPVIAANRWLQGRQLHKVALFVSSATCQDFDNIESVALDQDTAVDAVIVGDLGEAWNFDLLNRAFRFLMQDPQPALIALGMTRYWRGPNGLQLDVAPFIKALEHAASCEAYVVGKPAPAFFELSLALLNRSADQAYMIGDDIAGDIDAAQQCGIRGIQVKTGKFLDTDLNRGIKPFALLDSIAGVPQWWSQAVEGNPEGA